MKILLVYPGQVFSTYDVALGYHEALSALGHEVYPYYYHDWLNYHEGALVYWATVNPSLGEDERRDAWYRLASRPLIVSAVEFQPDVILIVHGLLLHAHTYELLNRLDIPTAVILTECPYIDDWQKRMIEAALFDCIFVNDRLSTGVFDATYLPHSYSTFRHRPGRVNPEYATDVYFHGTWFEERAALFGGLNGCDARIVGVGWQDDISDIGTPNGELVKYYQSTRIALNHHRTTVTVDSPEKAHGESLGPRAYEIAACGAFQLCDDTRPELAEVFGDTVATYHDRADLEDKITYYLSHEDERLDMADAAFKRVEPCSFYDRARYIVIPALEAL